MTSFELKNNRIKKVKEILEWALKNSDINGSYVYTKANEYGMRELKKPTDISVGELIESVDEESTKTLKIQLKWEHLIFDFDVYKDGDLYMVNIGLPEKFFNELDKLDILRKV